MTYLKKRFNFIMILLLLGTQLSATNFKEAVADYNKGAYIQALNGFFVLAKEGNVLAQHNTALMYALGKGAKKDMSKAIKWYEKAAKQDYAIAAYNLAQIYHVRGSRNPHDYEKARFWYEKAIKGDIKEAYNNLATFYLEGINVPKDTQKALKLLEKSAALGDAYGQINVAILYAWGEGIINNKMKAYENLKKALSAGKNEASGYLDKLCKESAWVCKD
jgi:TPR repeat protein